jgi:hypothetical protein
MDVMNDDGRRKVELEEGRNKHFLYGGNAACCEWDVDAIDKVLWLSSGISGKPTNL